MIAATPQQRSFRRPLLPEEPAAAHLLAPPLRTGLVNRVALVNRLRTERAAVVLLTAPAGYGKTTLLAQWAQRDERDFVWVRLGPGDGESASFAHLLVAAVRRLGIGEDLETAPRGRPLHPRTIVRRLGRALLAHSSPLVVVLDNVEELDRAESVELVETLCEHLPKKMQLVLSGRRAPRLPLARLRAEGRLAELGTPDLRLTGREAQTLLNNAGVDAAAADVEELNGRADGWVTGLYLGALALQPRQGRPLRAPSGIDGAHHFVSDYLEEEVLDRIAADDVDFLVGASLVETLSGPMLDAVLERTRSRARLRALADAGVFLVPLDRERTRFRFHPFFRDMLRSRLEQGAPARFAELSARAADWSERAGQIPEAIGYLRAIGDRDGAARLLGVAAPDVIGRGLLGAFEPCLRELRDRELLTEHPDAAAVGAVAHAFLGHAAEADRWGSAADGRRSEGPAVTSVLRAALCCEGVERMREDGATAADALRDSSPLYAAALLLLGVAQSLARDPLAVATLADAVEAAESDDAPLVASIALAELSLLAQERSEWTRGEELARRARDLAAALEPGHCGGALAFVASARSALRNSNWVRAEDDIERVHRLLPRLTEALPWLAVQVRLELAGCHLALNDVGAADEISTELDRLLLLRPHLGRLRDEVLALRQRVDGLRGRPSAIGHTLTAAELRLLPLLTTHLTFRQIAEHLYVSRNTIKTQAISVYRKLGVSSRTEAIDRAIEVGLLRPEGDVLERIA